MIQQIIAASTLIGFITMIFVAPYFFSKGIYLIEFGELEKSDRLKRIVPIYNIINAERLYTAKMSKVGLVTIFFILAITIRLLVVFFIPNEFIVQLSTVVVFAISLCSIYIVNMWLVFMVLSDAGTLGGFATLFYSVVFPLGQYYIGDKLPKVIKYYNREEDTF